MARPRKAAEDTPPDEEATTDSLEHETSDDEPDADATYGKRLSELEDRIAALESAVRSQLNMTV